MEKIKSLVVVSTITIILLLTITEQVNAIVVDDADCIEACSPNCEHTCKSKGYTGWFCGAFRVKSACCCTPKKKTFGQFVQRRN
ncbi:hypothetical protein N665_2239s0003 [Sinapis alba]|nr:hypothetical protein N665_2239s0003 [Sinapis alba]